MSRIAILGAGAWGTALAISLARRGGHQLCLWAHSPEHTRQLAETGENARYLPGYILPADVEITPEIGDAISDAEIILCVTPSQALRSIMKQIASHLTPAQILLSASKGIEEKTFLRMSQVMVEYTEGDNPIAVIGGPSFAQEVAAAMPTALSVACDDPAVGTRLQNDFSSPSLRVSPHASGNAMNCL